MISIPNNKFSLASSESRLRRIIRICILLSPQRHSDKWQSHLVACYDDTRLLSSLSSWAGYPPAEAALPVEGLININFFPSNILTFNSAHQIYSSLAYYFHKQHHHGMDWTGLDRTLLSENGVAEELHEVWEHIWVSANGIGIPLAFRSRSRGYKSIFGFCELFQIIRPGNEFFIIFLLVLLKVILP